MSTLAVVEVILRETGVPMSVRQIVEHAAGRLPTRSKTPDTVVARDLSMDIKKRGEVSLFVRTSPGRYTLRELSNQRRSDHCFTEAKTHPGVTSLPLQPELKQAQGSATTTTAETASRPDHDDTTDLLASAMRAGRAGTLAANSAEKTTHDERQTRRK